MQVFKNLKLTTLLPTTTINILKQETYSDKNIYKSKEPRKYEGEKGDPEINDLKGSSIYCTRKEINKKV